MWSSDLQRLISSISPDSTGAVFFCVCGGVLSWQQARRSIMGVLHLRLTLVAAADCGAEPRADWLSAQYEHDAICCSLRGVSNPLQGPKKAFKRSMEAIYYHIGIKCPLMFKKCEKQFLLLLSDKENIILWLHLMTVTSGHYISLFTTIFF